MMRVPVFAVLAMCGAALILIVLGVPAPAALAAWPNSGFPIATGPTYQTLPVGVTAPGGDLLTFWIDFGPPIVLRSQRVTIRGTIADGWPAEGRRVVYAEAWGWLPQLTPDGTGGYLLAWY